MNCCILGAGAWGTAMALHLDRCGHSVTLVPRRMEHALEIASLRENFDYLPGYKLPNTIQIGGEFGPVLMEAEVVFIACPSKAMRALCELIKPHLEVAWQLKLCLIMCKGLELETFKTPAEIAQEALPGIACGVLSGPTFAGEVAEGKPTAPCSPWVAIVKTPSVTKALLAMRGYVLTFLMIYGAPSWVER